MWISDRERIYYTTRCIYYSLWYQLMVTRRSKDILSGTSFNETTSGRFYTVWYWSEKLCRNAFCFNGIKNVFNTINETISYFTRWKNWRRFSIKWNISYSTECNFYSIGKTLNWLFKRNHDGVFYRIFYRSIVDHQWKLNWLFFDEFIFYIGRSFHCLIKIKIILVLLIKMSNDDICRWCASMRSSWLIDR